MIQYGLDYIWGGGMIGKITEAEPLVYNAETFYEVVFSPLGLNLLFSLAGIAAAIVYIRRSDRKKRDGQLLLLVWAIYTIILTFGQARFLYVSMIAMGVLISIFFFLAMELVDKKLAAAKPKSSKGMGSYPVTAFDRTHTDGCREYSILCRGNSASSCRRLATVPHLAEG